MTMFNRKKISREDAKKLLDAYLEHKTAKAKFEKLKEQLTKDLPEGKIEFEGLMSITKTSYVRPDIDKNKLLDDHPEIDPSRYTKMTTVTSVTISNLRK